MYIVRGNRPFVRSFDIQRIKLVGKKGRPSWLPRVDTLDSMSRDLINVIRNVLFLRNFLIGYRQQYCDSWLGKPCKCCYS